MSNFLSAAELASMQASLEDVALPNVGNILSVTYTYDGMGGAIPTWGTATSNVAYRLDFKTGNEPVVGGAARPFSYWVLSLPHSATITTDNRFEDADGNQYSVSSVDKERSYHLFMEVMVEKV